MLICVYNALQSLVVALLQALVLLKVQAFVSAWVYRLTQLASLGLKK